MKITKHAQSCFLIESGEDRILIDPGNFLVEKEKKDLKEFSKLSAILLTHEHKDHTFPPILRELVEQHHCPVFANRAVVRLLEGEGLEAKPVIPRDIEQVGKFTFEVVGGAHGPLPDGRHAPEEIGYLISAGETVVYHPGDTLLLEVRKTVTVMLLPTTGTVTLSVEEGAEWMKVLKPKIVVPCHYDNPKYEDRHRELGPLLPTGIEFRPLTFGEAFEL